MESCCKHGLISISFLFLIVPLEKKCLIFAVHSTFLNSVSQVGADHHVDSWGESSDAFLEEWKAKVVILILIQPFKKIPPIQIWHWGFVFSWSSLLLEVPVSSVGCLLPRVFLDIQLMWTAREQDSPPSPAVLLLSLTDAWQAQPCAANSTERIPYFTKLLRSKPQVSLPNINKEGLEVCIF